ncbi:hydrogenase, partial [Thermococci archaeon]
MTLTAEGIFDRLKEELGDAILNYEFREYKMGVKRPRTYKEVWMEIDKNAFKKAVKTIFEIDYPHLHFITGEDIG